MPGENGKAQDMNSTQKSKSNDHDLWRKVKDYSKGGIQKRIEAISIIFNQKNELPAQWMDLAYELASKEQPKEVRIALAKSFAASSLSTVQHFSILKILAKDPDEEVSQIVDTVLTKYRQQFDFLDSFNNGFNKATEEMRAKERETALNIIVQRQDMFGQLAGSMNKRQQDMFGQLAGSMNKRQQDMFGQLSGKAFSPIIGNIGIANLTPIKNLINPILSYYPVSELSTVETERRIPPRSKADTYVKKLQECKPGTKQWNNYQELCARILSYCLVPPLQEPVGQSSNFGGAHIRDIIFHIPHNIGDFWNWLIIKYGVAIVVECKNYANALNENQVVITSKYLGKKKLTTLGLVLARKGVGKSAHKAQIEQWVHNDLLVICLDDNDLAKMLELREKSQEPCKIIDNAIRKLLESV